MFNWAWWVPRKGVGMSSPESTVIDEGVSRREFLYVGGVSALGLSLGEAAAHARAATVQRRRVIFLMMAGGPSQLDTFDPKPEAPAQVRGPCRAMQTCVPGLWLADSLPRLAERADQFALIRSLNHEAAPIHETGQQLLQCGRLVERGIRFPHFGSVIAREMPRGNSVPANVVVPTILRGTGTHQERGQSAGSWGDDWNPLEVQITAADEPEAVRRAYGDTHFGRLLLQARRQIEQGSRCVTVNLFDNLHQQMSWDSHGDPQCGPATVYDYRDTLCPQFDRALAALFDDLQQRGLWHDTLIVATGEFGRTPFLNDRAGRDHWPGCWSALVAGGGVTGGAVIGASDAIGSAPIDRPVSPSELTATMLAWFGIDGREVTVGNGTHSLPLLSAAPLYELWS